MLTKSEFLRYLECPIHLWLWKNRRTDIEGSEDDAQVQWILEQGNMVEDVARKLYPGGAHVKAFHDAGAKKTQELAADGKNLIYQATAIAEGLLAMADVLQKDGDLWNIIEVKGSTEVKKDHIHDVCFQRLAFRKAGYDIGKLFLAHVNKDFVKHGDIDPQEFITVGEITDQVNEVELQVEAQVQKALELIERKDTPTRTDVTCTCSAKDCPCLHYCYPDLPDYSVFNLSRIRTTKAQELYEAGIRAITDLPQEYSLSTAQVCQVQAARDGKPIIETKDIKKELSKLEYPLYFLDYETFFPAIPLFDGYKPYQQMVFQYSLHVLREPDAEVEHYEYLADALENPAETLAQRLSGDIDSDGSVIVWNKSFEMSRNKEIAELVPAHAPFLLSINERVYDLMEIFRKQLYVHPDFRGSCSIKDVLPVLVPELSYKDLEIQEGGTASLSWYRMLTDGRSEQEKIETCSHMRKYCELDTLAMVEIFHILDSL